ncbi:hypothetical protein [uncultured Paracoccus sp.]|uniref:hypothetical protein n=1 Tax=uncultured Paracoccus sp. TaxID=189685 RepID=UPI002591C31F|nr:hypothetical protein [uncultured Paracoccus sp.]
MENEIIMRPDNTAADSLVAKWNEYAAKEFPMSAEERAEVAAKWDAILSAMEE